MAADGFDWWIKRIEKAQSQFDIIRIDHFRGLDRYYAIPADREDALEGEWMPGPGMRLFYEIKRRLGDVNIIAEDLGEMDAGVARLMERTGFPGMKVLQFAFDNNPENPYLPANFGINSVVYTGTHDNDTSLGYINTLDDKQFASLKTQIRAALKSEGVVHPFVTREQTALAMNVCALASSANIAVLPVQDVACLGSEARMNTPSTPEGNWQYRMETFPTRRSIALLKRGIEQFNR